MKGKSTHTDKNSIKLSVGYINKKFVLDILYITLQKKIDLKH